jgi:hypothetical protein
MTKQAIDFKQKVVDAWYIADGADGSRGGMQAALDQIQEVLSDDFDPEEFESEFDTSEAEQTDDLDDDEEA